MRTAIIAIVFGLSGCAATGTVAEHLHVNAGISQSCAKSCSPGVCQSAVDTDPVTATPVDCEDLNADLCVCSLE